MKASGLFFLTTRPSLVHRNSPTDGAVVDWSFQMLERTGGNGVQRVMAYWRGTDAARFIEANPGITRGQALLCEFERVRPVDDRLEARMVSCALAADRWPKHDSATNSITTKATA